MREDSPRWTEMNRSEFSHERDGLRALASYLPDEDPYHVWSNVEFIAGDGSINEVDALVLTPGGFHLLELKHWQGEISGGQSQWVRRASARGRLFPTDNPLLLANRKAKRLAGLVKRCARQQGLPAEGLFIDAAIFLHAPNMVCRLDSLGRTAIYGLDGGRDLPSLRDFLTRPPVSPDRRIDAARGRQIVAMLQAAQLRPSVADRKVGERLLLRSEPFAEGLGWQDFLAGHASDRTLMRRVRIYLTGGKPADEVAAIERAAEREFRLLQGIHHPGIPQAVDHVPHVWGPAVVFDHQEGRERLDHWVLSRDRSLTTANRLKVIQQLAEIVSYAHSRHLIHRALHPGVVWVAAESTDQSLVVTDWQTGGRLPASTNVSRLASSDDSANLELFLTDDSRNYQAPEAGGSAKGRLLDVFSLGALTYWLFTGRAPAESPAELAERVRDSGLNMTAVVDELPDSLVQLVYDATRGDPRQRLATVSAFLSGLDNVWEELTAPEPEPVIDPLDAHPGDVLPGGLTVQRRLGSGSTATALLVTRENTKTPLVLKVARDDSAAARLDAEADVLRRARDSHVAALIEGPIEVGERRALLLESAGERTLSDELRGGRLALDLLERYGRDLMEIVLFLDRQAVWHRDIKPANLAARPQPKDRVPHLCLFDFSLAGAPARDIEAGTTPYLDPFLADSDRGRYDGAAERFAAAVTLFEMATGRLPRWGEDANPLAISDEVTVDESMFDPAVADRLVTFFVRALARRVGARYATAEEMADAWRDIFRNVPRAGTVTMPEAPALTVDTLLSEAGFTQRARSALERLDLHLVGDLLAAPPAQLTRARNVPNATRREILARRRQLQEQLGDTPEEEPGVDAAAGIEELCAELIPAASRNAAKVRALGIVLGQEPTDDGRFLHWLGQTDAAKAIGVAQPQISVWLRERTPHWLTALEPVRDELVALLDARGGVMSADELASALISTHGSYTASPKREAQAVGVVRAAVEAELYRGGDARVAIRRFRKSDCVLIGREPDDALTDPESSENADRWLAAAVRLGQTAAELAGGDPLPSRRVAIAELRRIPLPERMTLSDDRLLQLAAVASNGMAAVNQQGQLYPVGMPAERALRLSAGSLAGQRLSPQALIDRVSARFPASQPLARRQLTDLLQRCDVPLGWNAATNRYEPRTAPSARTSDSHPASTWTGRFISAREVDEIGERLSAAIEGHRYLAVLSHVRRLEAHRQALLERYQLTEVNVTAILLDTFRGLPYDWDTIIAADSGVAGDADYQSLLDLVRHHVVPAVREALAAPTPLLITEAAPLARYDALRPLVELADPAHPRPAARFLLVPARYPEPPMLDDKPVPHTSRGQLAWLPESWLTRTAERTTSA